MNRSETVPARLEPQPFPLNPGGCGGLHVPGRRWEDSGPAPALEEQEISVGILDIRCDLLQKLLLYYHVGGAAEGTHQLLQKVPEPACLPAQGRATRSPFHPVDL